MVHHSIVLPSKPKIVSEDNFKAVFEIDGLYPGFGHTLGNSLRRIILSSLPGAAITTVKIDGVSHEFSVLDGVEEDVITILLNLKKIRLSMTSDEPQTLVLKAKGPSEVTAKDIEANGQVTILNPEQIIAHITNKSTDLSIEMTIEKGLGYVPKEAILKNRVDIGTIALDASFSPISRVNYEVENMRVGERTDFNRLRITIETDATIAPAEALARSIEIMISQLKAIVGFKEEEELVSTPVPSDITDEKKDLDPEFLKTRIESLNLSSRTVNALIGANIRTVGGLVRKKERDIADVEGLGTKGIIEIKKVLGDFGVTLK
jgi:DNA-directed RNA polymerase subunit alpha